MQQEAIARLCHEANRGYCESLGDYSQVPWDDAPDWQRTSVMNGVKAILAKPHLTPEQSHEAWMAEKEADGWTFGEVKDPALKTHPCMLPYGILPREQRAKDHIFGALVRACATMPVPV